MDRFVEATTHTLKRIYVQVWVQAQPTGKAASALDLSIKEIL